MPVINTHRTATLVALCGTVATTLPAQGKATGLPKQVAQELVTSVAHEICADTSRSIRIQSIGAATSWYGTREVAPDLAAAFAAVSDGRCGRNSGNEEPFQVALVGLSENPSVDSVTVQWQRSGPAGTGRWESALLHTLFVRDAGKYTRRRTVEISSFEFFRAGGVPRGAASR